MATRLAAVAAIALLLATATRGYADDNGPRRALHAIRHDLPLILSHKGKVVVDDVVVKDDEAIVQWHIGDRRQIDAMTRTLRRWWLTGTYCGHWLKPPSKEILTIAAQHIPMMMPSPTASPSDSGNCTPATNGLIRQPSSFWQSEDGYRMTLQDATSDAALDDAFTNVELRAPTEAESWLAYPGGNSEFFFSATVKSASAVHVQSGTTIAVWFPFVLEPEQRYSLTIAHTDEPIGPIFGTLKDNTLQFVLPAFSMKPGAHLMGEIEYLPPRRD